MPAAVEEIARRIRQFWPDHRECVDDLSAEPLPLEDATEGLVCACGTVLGWPVEDEPFDPDDPGPGNPPWNTGQDEHELAASYVDAPDEVVAEEARAQSERREVLQPVRESAVRPADPIKAAVSKIDPTQPYTPAQVEAQMIDIMGRLESGEHFLRICIDNEHLAKVDYELSFARQIAGSSHRAADQRRADALIACETEYRAMIETASISRAMRDTLHSLRSMLTGYQTVSNSIRSSMNGPAVGSNR